METTASHEPAGGDGPFAGSVLGNPVVQTLVAMASISAALLGGVFPNGVAPTPLQSTPFDPWSGVVVSIFAHSEPTLLVANLAVVGVVGGAFLRETSRVRWHLFFLGAGASSALVYAWTTDATVVAGVGSSGAASALVGYLATGRILPTDSLNPTRKRVALGVFAGLGLAFSIAAFPGNGTYPAHLSGAIVGLVAGRLRLLRRD